MTRLFRCHLREQSLRSVVLPIVTRNRIQNLARGWVVTFFRKRPAEIVLRGYRGIECQRCAESAHRACHVTRQKGEFPRRELLLCIVGVEFGSRMVKLFSALKTQAIFAWKWPHSHRHHGNR